MASVCPGLPSNGTCVDFTTPAGTGRAWDGIAGTTTTPSTLLANTNATPGLYSSAASVSTVSANTPALGAAGLQTMAATQNLLTYSNTFSNAAWVKYGTGFSVGTQSLTAPDGTTTAWNFSIPASAAGGNNFTAQQAFTSVVGDVYNCSVWLESNNASITVQTYLELQKSTANYNVLAPHAQQYINIPPSNYHVWKRYFVQGVALTTGTVFGIGNNTSSTTAAYGPNQPYVGDPTLGSPVGVWGAQCEHSPLPHAYIANASTTLNSATADTVTATGDLAAAIQSSNATLAVSTDQGYESQYGGTPATTAFTQNVNLVSYGAGPTQLLGVNYLNNGVSGSLSTPTTGTLSGPATWTLAWNGSGGTINLNGTSSAPDATARTPSGTITLGNCNCFITSVAVYPSAIPIPTYSSPITSLSFNLTGSAGTPGPIARWGTGAQKGDTLHNAWSQEGGISPTGGDVYANINDSYGTCGGSNSFAAAPLHLYSSGTSPWNPSSQSGLFGACDYASTFNASPYYLGTSSVKDNTNNDPQCPSYPTTPCLRMWKSSSLISVNGVIYESLSRQNYGDSTADFPSTACVYATCWLDLQYAYYTELAKTSSSITTGNPLTTSTAWTASGSGFPSYANGPVTTPTFNTRFFSQAAFVKVGQDYNPASTYGGGSTYFCAGGVAGGCPDGTGSYLYAVAGDGAAYAGNSITLGRVSLTNLPNLNGAQWQFWDSNGAGCSNSVTDANCWVTDVANIGSSTPILGGAYNSYPIPQGINGQMDMAYLPAAGGRFLLVTFFYPSNQYNQAAYQSTFSIWNIYDCAHLNQCNLVQQIPWDGFGPTNTIYSGTALSGFYMPAIVNKSVGVDGGLTVAFLASANWASTATYGPSMLGAIVNR